MFLELLLLCKMIISNVFYIFGQYNTSELRKYAIFIYFNYMGLKSLNEYGTVSFQ